MRGLVETAATLYVITVTSPVQSALAGAAAGYVPEPPRSKLAQKMTRFVTALLVWVALVFIAHDVGVRGLDATRTVALAIAVTAAAAFVSRYTMRILTRPLTLLEEGVRTGEPVMVSPTGDEIERIAAGINALIASASKPERPEVWEQKIRQRTEALEEATSRALAASRAKSEFLANMSHELRTPMGGILGMIDLAMEGQTGAAQKEHLETAKGCAQNLLALLNDILDLSKIEAGKMLLEKASFDPREVAKQCARSFSRQCAEKGVELREHYDTSLPAQLVGDQLRVRQILINLLSNAVKFTSTGYVELSADYRPDATSGGSIIFRVTDTGSGIQRDKLEAIFEEFTQADGSVSRRFGGTGLGLAITRRLVELHRGAISVTSEPGQGSTFTVDLRFEAAPKPVSGSAPKATFDTATAEQPGKTATILLCEDNSVNQRVMRAILEKQGHSVIIAGDGYAALTALEENPVDLILMDVQMPEMDGITAAKLIREKERWRNLPIVAITAHAMNGDRERCLQAGMTGYISKPVAPKVLVATVQDQLNGKFEVHCSTNTMIAVAHGHPEPIDRRLAAKLMGPDRELMKSMTALFLQLAPERIQKLQLAAARLDSFGLRSHAEKLSTAAERIAAVEVSNRAKELAADAPNLNPEALLDKINDLDKALRRLDRHVRKQERKSQDVAAGGKR